MLKRLILAAGLLALLVQPAPARVSVVLVDGRVLEGLELSREGSDYALETAPGEVVVIPAAFVSEVRLEQTEAEEPEPPEEDPDAWRHKSGVISGEARTLGGQDPPEDAPTGINRNAQPQTLAGDPVRPPRTSEQLEVFGGAAEFQKDVVANDWVPTTDWDMVNGENNWAPSTWSEDIIDPSWEPEPAFRAEDDQLKQHESDWQKPIIDNSWHPTDAFGK